MKNNFYIKWKLDKDISLPEFVEHWSIIHDNRRLQ